MTVSRKRRIGVRWGTALCLAAAVASGEARQQTPQRAPGMTHEGVRAVLVDVVVRDKRGQPVRDLSPSDFELTEDGVPQTIGSFTPVFEGAGLRQPTTAAAPATGAPATGTPAASGAAAAAPAVNAGPIVTALVFDRLSPEARRLAIQAAKNYLGRQTETPSYIGIFGVDLALTPYAPFTRNARVLRDALDRMSNRGSSTFNSPEQQQQKANADQQATTSAAAADAAIAGAAGSGGSVGTAAGDALLGQMESNIIQGFELMERDQQGYSTTNGLFAIVNALGALPGRKSLILFSEGIAIPPAVQRLFLGVVAAANRANVSIYAMDAAGLRAESEQGKIGVQVNQAAGGGGGILSHASGTAPLSRAMEKNEDVLRQDPHYGLGTLAQDTGGLLFDSTNNLRQGFDRVETDLRNYYLVGYTPTNDTYDGHFRTIDVKVKRPGVTVAARKGYFALRDAGGGAVNSWEAPALGELERKPVPNAFPIRAAALLFPERDRPGLVPVVVDLSTAALTFQPAADGKTYSSDFAILARFLDQKDKVVRQVSQHYEVNGPIGDIARAKQGEVIFYREPELPPGLYTMETVVYDAPSGKSSVRFSTVEVPVEAPAGLRMSSLVLVKRGEKVDAKDRRAGNPLMVKDLLLYPNLGDAVSKATKELGFYVTVYPLQGGPAPESTLQLLLNGAPVAQVPLPLGAADALGRIQQVGRLPLDQIAPGLYELRVVVKQGPTVVSRATVVSIID
jgi:VWFA-related protein